MVTSNGWLTDVLILFPFAGALLVWLLPLPRTWTASFALFFSLSEVGLWIDSVLRFDFTHGAASGAPRSVLDVQLATHWSWFKDLGVSYSVGMHSYALWLVGLSVVAMAAAVGFAVWVDRERARAYYGLMLLLTGAIVGVFTAQDLLLFYVFWEAMLIPIYILVGVWGGPRRLAATLKFVVYTMAGSLLMLASIVVLGVQRHTFDITALQAKPSSSMWLLLGFAAAFAVKAPLFPFHGWLPDAYRESPPEVAGVLSGVVSKAATFGFLNIALLGFAPIIHDLRTPVLVLASIGLVYGSLLAFRAPDLRGVIGYSSLAQMGLITIGLFATNLSGWNGAFLQMVNHGLISMTLFLLAGIIETRTSTGRLDRLGGAARGRPVLATVLMATGVIALAVPGSTAFAGEFLILAGVFVSGWAWAVIGVIAIVLAAMYMLRVISAVLHRTQGQAVTPALTDLRGELAIVLPLLGCLLALSAWPAGLTDRFFTSNPGVNGIQKVIP